MACIRLSMFGLAAAKDILLTWEGKFTTLDLGPSLVQKVSFWSDTGGKGNPSHVYPDGVSGHLNFPKCPEHFFLG